MLICFNKPEHLTQDTIPLVKIYFFTGILTSFIRTSPGQWIGKPPEPTVGEHFSFRMRFPYRAYKYCCLLHKICKSRIACRWMYCQKIFWTVNIFTYEIIYILDCQYFYIRNHLFWTVNIFTWFWVPGGEAECGATIYYAFILTGRWNICTAQVQLHRTITRHQYLHFCTSDANCWANSSSTCCGVTNPKELAWCKCQKNVCWVN